MPRAPHPFLYNYSFCYYLQSWCVFASQEKLFSWRYLGYDKKYINRVFKCPRYTRLVDDTDIYLPNSGIVKENRYFTLDNISSSGQIHGYYFIYANNVKKKVSHIRGKGHVRPCDEFSKLLCPLLVCVCGGVIAD